jgi:hypothetical protein
MRTRKATWTLMFVGLVLVGSTAVAGCAAEAAPVDLNPQPLPPEAPGLNPQPLPPEAPDQSPAPEKNGGDTVSVSGPGGTFTGGGASGSDVPGTPSGATNTDADGGAPPCPYGPYCVRVTNRAKF